MPVFSVCFLSLFRKSWRNNSHREQLNFRRCYKKALQTLAKNLFEKKRKTSRSSYFFSVLHVKESLQLLDLNFLLHFPGHCHEGSIVIFAVLVLKERSSILRCSLFIPVLTTLGKTITSKKNRTNEQEYSWRIIVICILFHSKMSR